MRGVGVVAFSLLVASVSCTFSEYKPSCAVASIPGFQATFVPATGAHLQACDLGPGTGDKGEYLVGNYDQYCFSAATRTDAECSAFHDVNPACAKCIESHTGDSAWGPIVSLQNYVDLNAPGCVALAGNASDQDCAAKKQALIRCGEAACASCDSVAAPLADFQSCEDAAYADVCKSYSDDLGDCWDHLSAAVVKTCDVGDSDADKELLTIAIYICGG